MKKQLILIVITLSAFLGSCPQFLLAQESVPVIQTSGPSNPVLNANSDGSTLGSTLGKPKSKKTSGFKKGKKTKTKKFTRYKKKGGKAGNGQSGDSGSDGSQTEVSGQKDVSNQADNSKK